MTKSPSSPVVRSTSTADGNDTLLTGRGNDTVTGGTGTDSISTGGGNDSIFADDTQIDTLIGGTGDDVTQCDSSDIISSVTKVGFILVPG